MRGKTYEEFVEKFKPKKTTDDCYTPQGIYEVIKDWVCEKYDVKEESIMRPFKQGGDYQAEKYQEGCLVLDNPPFSIYTQICEYYLERDIKFFLFAPSLTCLSGSKIWNRMNHIICDCNIIYENGARVKTSFVTNLDTEIVLQTSPELTEIVNQKMKELQKEEKKQLPKYEYPDHVITAAAAQRLAHYGAEFKVHKNDCVRISKLDAQEKKGIFGGGLLLSERAAAERAAAERAAGEKETAITEKFELTEREKQIVKSLG